ncbi:MAG: hypothetical protein HYR55_03580 [Acidobacteria bacterium]|nr:hypothetical protein [Acidobacteriota bacterium]MBI3656923.1 hypothetical protein [Acidobacteriota bacterium]
MSGTLCVVCNRKKAKRHCPAKFGSICSTCCGAKRIIEIQCPDDCTYLISGRDHRAQEVFARQRAKSDSIQLRKDSEIMNKFGDFMCYLQFMLVALRKDNRRMTDAETLAGVGLLLKTYETENKGILYEYHSPRAEVEAIVLGLHRAIQKYRSEETPIAPRHIVNCLELLNADLDFHCQENKSTTSYLELITQFFPNVNRQAGGSRIIIPGHEVSKHSR